MEFRKLIISGGLGESVVYTHTHTGTETEAELCKQKDAPRTFYGNGTKTTGLKTWSK